MTSIFFIILSIACFCLKTEPRLRVPDLSIRPLWNGSAHRGRPPDLGFAVEKIKTRWVQCSVRSTPTYRAHPHFFYLELIANIWFTWEILMRLLFSPCPAKFVRNPINLIDFIATASFYVDWLLEHVLDGNHRDTIEFCNIVRIFRLFKLTQHSSGLNILIETFKASARVSAGDGGETLTPSRSCCCSCSSCCWARSCSRR